MKPGTTGHPKFKLLKIKLKLPEYIVTGILESLWNLTAKWKEYGGIGEWTNSDIAAAMEYEGDADAMIAALVETGWLDKDEKSRLTVHDWDEHKPKYLVDRHRKRKNDEDGSGDSATVAEGSGKSPPTHTHPYPPTPTHSHPNKPTQAKDGAQGCALGGDFSGGSGRGWVGLPPPAEVQARFDEMDPEVVRAMPGVAVQQACVFVGMNPSTAKRASTRADLTPAMFMRHYGEVCNDRSLGDRMAVLAHRLQLSKGKRR
jgi:hypothetical protein